MTRKRFVSFFLNHLGDRSKHKVEHLISAASKAGVNTKNIDLFTSCLLAYYYAITTGGYVKRARFIENDLQRQASALKAGVINLSPITVISKIILNPDELNQVKFLMIHEETGAIFQMRTGGEFSCLSNYSIKDSTDLKPLDLSTDRVFFIPQIFLKDMAKQYNPTPVTEQEVFFKSIG